MVISLSDFNNLSEKEKKETLQDLKTQMGVSGIVKEWSISRSKAYGMLNELNIPLNPKGFKGAKTKTVSSEGDRSITKIQEDQANQISADTTNNKKKKSQKTLKKTTTPAPSLEFAIEDNLSKFSLYLETQGTTSLISETLQTLLGSEKLTNSNLHMNITLQEI